MSATNISIAALLLAAAAGTALTAAVLHGVRGLRRDVQELRSEIAAQAAGAKVPTARAVPAEEIRSAVAEALADERERELAEARAFWAEQESHEGPGTGSLFGGLAEGGVFIPRQADLAGLEPLLEPAEQVQEEEESPELAAARRRHPSHPDFKPQAIVADHDRTLARMEDLSELRTPLVEVRPGPLGTLDVYVFADGTTLCLSPGHRDTADQLCSALDAGNSPVLMGGSAVSGAFALTFACGEESVYVLADRVIASL